MKTGSKVGIGVGIAVAIVGAVAILFFGGFSPTMTLGTGIIGQAVDSDGDGLTDAEEIAWGTNPNAFDTDGDGLSDGREKQMGTNPLSRNTDNDRYDDASDPQPTVKNSAELDIRIVNSGSEVNYVNAVLLGATLGGAGALDPNMELIRTNVDLTVANTGNDYTSYVRFDAVFKYGGQEVKRVTESLGQLDAGRQLSKHYSYSITLSDVPRVLWGSLVEQNSNVTFQLQNIQYERY